MVNAMPPTALRPGENWYPLYRRQGGPQGQFGVENITPHPLGFDPWAVQAITSRYTDWVIPAHNHNNNNNNNNNLMHNSYYGE